MLTEETHSAGVADEKVAGHEDAAHEKRNWVRLTFDCNNRCIFCLDSDAHDGQMREADDVKKQILEGRRKGATRLILSGGEPTIHPRYVDFIKLGKLAGYRKIQTVTNGRLFQYDDFLGRCLDAGLSEITFSLHGPNARIHDALVGVKGAFEQEIVGLQKAIADGRPIVNVDVVINRGNVRVLPEMLERFYAMGVREFDLLQVVPFGRAYTEGKDTLFYDLEEAAPYIREALRFSERPDVHVWLNRFPPAHLEGYEHLIQDPYKLNDEVRGRKEEFEKQLEHGEPLDCREPARCRYCYLQKLCDELEDAQRMLHEERFERLVLDAGWEKALPPVFGGDPASSRKISLPLAHQTPRLTHRDLVERARRAGARSLDVRAPDLEAARRALAPFAGLGAEVELELEEYAALPAALEDGRLDGRTLARAVAATTHQAERLLAIDGSFEVVVLLSRETAAWIASPDRLAQGKLSSRFVVRQPTYERLTEAAANDVDLPSFFAALAPGVPVEGVPACVLGREPRTLGPTFDSTMSRPDGRLEIFRYTKRFILDGYRTKSLRCRTCAHDASCEGLHINQVRAHGYRWMQPIAPAASNAAE